MRAYGKSTKNMAGRKAPRPDYQLFLDPESSRSPTAITQTGAGEPKYWTLPEAVYYLCGTLNLFEAFIANPNRRELEAVLPKDDNLIRNHECRLGAYLPEQLDDLLDPYGFSWTIDFLARGRRKIRVFQRGAGKRTILRIQAPGSIVDMEKTNVEGLSLHADVGDRAFNRVEVLGDYTQYESTFELVRCWSVTLDNRVVTDLQKNADAWITTPALERVWRDWILNEAGDYNHLRSPPKRINSTRYPALKTLQKFSEFLPPSAIFLSSFPRRLQWILMEDTCMPCPITISRDKLDNTPKLRDQEMPGASLYFPISLWVSLGKARFSHTKHCRSITYEFRGPVLPTSQISEKGSAAPAPQISRTLPTSPTSPSQPR